MLVIRVEKYCAIGLLYTDEVDERPDETLYGLMPSLV